MSLNSRSKMNLTGGSVNPKQISVPKYIPFCINMSKPEESIFDSENDVVFSTNIDYPRCSLGFQHFIHSIKNDTEMLKTFEGRKKVYQVMNPFERYIDKYNKSIGSVSVDYFGLGKGKVPDILSRGFYKLWEILFMFDLIDVTQDKFVSAHLAEGPGSFIQCTMFFRDMFCKNGLSKNDKYYAITLHPENTDGHVPELEKKFIEYYEKEKPQRFFQHKTYNKSQSGGCHDKDNGDLMDPKTLKNFYGGANSTVKEKVDLITADGGFEWVNENIQEQEYFKLLFSQIVTAVNIQKKGGNFVCKFFETYTTTSTKYICILASLYEKIFFVKPLTSRPSNSEKYAVCIGFKFGENDSKLKNIIKTLNDMHEDIHKNMELKIVDMFTKYVVPKQMILRLTQMNNEIANNQFKSIGEILTFVKSNNYNGETYEKKREEQIEAAKYWTDLFFMPPSEFKSHKLQINDISFISNKLNIDKVVDLEKQLIL